MINSFVHSFVSSFVLMNYTHEIDEGHVEAEVAETVAEVPEDDLGPGPHLVESAAPRALRLLHRLLLLLTFDVLV